jgi:hydroxyethylthiazole kinase-like uncharacterized protein yjeF
VPKELPPENWHGFPVLTAAAMRELDRLATESYKIPVLDLMENAGTAVAAATLRFMQEKLGKEPGAASIVVCCGRGANGGDGLVAARQLKNAGVKVSAFICPPKKEGGVPGGYPDVVRKNIDKAKAAGVPVLPAGPEAGLEAALASTDAALDALLGTGSSGKPAGAIHHMIQAMTRSKKPVLALDLPSGIHPDTGYHSGVFVTATATFTLGFPKRGLLAPHSKKYVGELSVLDIGYPKEFMAGTAELVAKAARP